MTWISLRGWWFTVALLPLTTIAAQPQAPARTHAQNYKDMVLATCIAQAYRDDAGAAVDAGSSASALRDWTYFDLDDSPAAVSALVNAYLARDYRNPLVEAEVRGVQFDFLKCLDLYHSKALDALAKRMVIEPSEATKPAATTD